MTHTDSEAKEIEIATFPEEKHSSDLNNDASVPKQSSWIGIVKTSLAILFLAVCIIVANFRIFGALPMEPVYSDQFFNIYIDTNLELSRTKEVFTAVQHQLLKSNCYIDRIAFGDTVVKNDITYKMEPFELDMLFTYYNLSSVVTNLEQLGNRSIVITHDPAKYSPSLSVLVLDITTEYAKLEGSVHKFLHERVLQVSGWNLHSEIYKKGSLLPVESVELVLTVKNAHPTETIPGSFRFSVIDEQGKRRSINPRQTFGQDILPGEEIKVTVPIRFNTKNSHEGAISSLFTELHIVAMDDQGENKFFVQGNYKFDTKLLQPMFEDYSGPKAVIFPFGAPGVGKTTFRNLVLYALGYITSFLRTEPVRANDTQYLSAKTIGNITIMDSFGIEKYFSERDVIRLTRGGLSNTTCLDEKSQKINFKEDSNGPQPNVLFFLHSYPNPVDSEQYNTLMKSVIINNQKSKRAEVAFGFTHVNRVSDNDLISKTNKLVSKENINVRHIDFDPPKRLEYHLDSDGKPTTRMMLEGLNNLVELTYKAANWDPNAIIDIPLP